MKAIPQQRLKKTKKELIVDVFNQFYRNNSDSDAMQHLASRDNNKKFPFQGFNKVELFVQNKQVCILYYFRLSTNLFHRLKKASEGN